MMKNKICEQIKRDQLEREKEKAQKADRGYNTRYATIAQGLAMQGYNQSRIAEFFGVSPSTITAWGKKHKEFRAALDSGKEMAAAELAGTAFRLATGNYVHEERKLEFDKAKGKFVERVSRSNLPPSEAMLKFLLPKVSPDVYSEQQDVNLHGDGFQVNISVVDEV